MVSNLEINKMLTIPQEILDQIAKNQLEKSRFELELVDRKFELVNWLGKVFKYRSYLEISTYNSGHFFNKVKDEIFTVKHCFNYENVIVKANVPDKNTKNNDHNFEIIDFEFGLKELNSKGFKYDVILVDSFHTFKQANLDIEAALSLVSKNGIIVIHDCNPKHNNLIGNEYRDGPWCGQTYESFIHFRANNSSLYTCVLDFDQGCGIIIPHLKIENHFELPENKNLEQVCEWKYFSSNRKSLLNLMNFEDFKAEIIEKLG